MMVIALIATPINARDQQQTIPKWKEENDTIIYKSVCYNYKKGSLDYRDCRNKAAKIFKKKCKETNERKFCKAKNSYKIIG